MINILEILGVDNIFLNIVKAMYDKSIANGVLKGKN